MCDNFDQMINSHTSDWFKIIERNQSYTIKITKFSLKTLKFEMLSNKHSAIPGKRWKHAFSLPRQESVSGRLIVWVVYSPYLHGKVNTAIRGKVSKHLCNPQAWRREDKFMFHLITYKKPFCLQQHWRKDPKHWKYDFWRMTQLYLSIVWL